MKFIRFWIFVLSCLIYSPLLDAQSSKTSITVRGMCEMCKERIEEAAYKVDGVLNANYNISKQELTVKSKPPFDVNELHLAMTKVGHDTDALKANDKTYNELHTCCKYRSEDDGGQSVDERHDNSVDDHEGHDHAAHDNHEGHDHKKPLSRFITGIIYEQDDDDNRIPLIGANVYWLGAQSGVVTNMDGSFEIGRIDGTDSLIISYVGYQPDTLDMSQTESFEWILSNDVILQEVQVTHRKKTSEISMIDPIQTINIGEEELCKAACCNLGESFETSPAVDATFTDAVTGTRQIQMLGLAGKYVQITRELIPDIRGLATIYGLTYTPGAWIESMQLSKGAGSVANGHEGMTGQINVELRKPKAKEEFFINLYGNEGGRYEGNLFTRHKLSRNWSTAFLIHGSSRDRRFDRNDDGFLDAPLARDFLAVNRWKYQHESGWQGQMGIKLNHVNRASGQIGFNEDEDKLSSEIWGSTNETRRYEAWMKIGKILRENLNESIGLQVSGVLHDQDLTFGLRQYNGEQDNLYANLIYQTDLVSARHVLRTGVNYVYDQYNENFIGTDFFRDEQTLGAYAEYTWKTSDLITTVAGMRGDYHNQYGIMISPRLHVRIALDESFQNVMRFSAGKGWRTANIFAENLGILATGRQFNVVSTESGNPYSLLPEEAWNFGFNYTREFFIGRRSGTLTLDYYYTLFENQIVADLESDENGTVVFANQPDMTDGHSIQAQLDLEVLPKFDIRTAYRYNYSEADFGGETKSLALTAFHRAFVNLAYEAPKNWHFDLTVNWRGPQRIPNTDWLEEEDRLDEMSPDFYTVNAQVRKIFKNEFELYVGGENLLNFRQETPIINPETPFADDFDASLVWGPIFGRNIYAGLRYRF